MNQVKKCKLSAIKAVKYNNCPCLKIGDLWHALHLTFNMAQNCQVDAAVLDEIPDKCPTSWSSFLEEEFTRSIANCNNLSTPGPNKLS